MIHKNISSWAEDFDYDELSMEANEYNLPLGVLEDACEVLTRSSLKRNKKQKNHKRGKECWQ
ncbi:MAG: hypothetical protein AB1782_08170 [Cyanobacteriota bacterium]